MGLEYKLTEIKDYKSVCLTSEGTLKAKTHAIIHAMMMLGLEGQITRKNLHEAQRQFAVLQFVAGPLLRDGQGQPVLLTAEDIEAHVGLWTNAFSPALNSKSGFKKFILAHLDDIDHVERRLAECYPNASAQVVGKREVTS